MKAIKNLNTWLCRLENIFNSTLLTPPVGNVLYILSDFSGMPITRIFRAMLPYVVGLLILDIILFFVPGITLFLPKLLLG